MRPANFAYQLDELDLERSAVAGDEKFTPILGRLKALFVFSSLFLLAFASYVCLSENAQSHLLNFSDKKSFYLEDFRTDPPLQNYQSKAPFQPNQAEFSEKPFQTSPSQLWQMFASVTQENPPPSQQDPSPPIQIISNQGPSKPIQIITNQPVQIISAQNFQSPNKLPPAVYQATPVTAGKEIVSFHQGIDAIPLVQPIQIAKPVQIAQPVITPLALAEPILPEISQQPPNVAEAKTLTGPSMPSQFVQGISQKKIGAKGIEKKQMESRLGSTIGEKGLIKKGIESPENFSPGLKLQITGLGEKGLIKKGIESESEFSPGVKVQLNDPGAQIGEHGLMKKGQLDLGEVSPGLAAHLAGVSAGQKDVKFTPSNNAAMSTALSDGSQATNNSK